jgi:hypothetical protein
MVAGRSPDTFISDYTVDPSSDSLRAPFCCLSSRRHSPRRGDSDIWTIGAAIAPDTAADLEMTGQRVLKFVRVLLGLSFSTNAQLGRCNIGSVTTSIEGAPCPRLPTYLFAYHCWSVVSC